mmetsp:Transcript_23544/g.76699  ORF Transcript_23544/g.76699 Transcript_23544/m.76699 type:complete len:181 (-) Transcript_23544:24-566(-)
MDPTVCPLLLLRLRLRLLLHLVLLLLCSVCAAPASLSLSCSSSLPLQAIYGGDLEVLELLSSTKGVDIHSLNNFGCGAAFWAAAAGNVDTCRWLLAKGIDFTLVNGAGHAAVHKAAWRGHREALEWMLLDPQGPRLLYQLRMQAADGRDPVQKASVNGHAAIASWLETLRQDQPDALPHC